MQGKSKKVVHFCHEQQNKKTNKQSKDISWNDVEDEYN